MDELFNQQHNLNWNQTFNMTAKAPAIDKRIFATYDDMLKFANDVSPKGTSINGIVLSVIKDDNPDNNGLYYLRSTATGEDKGDAVVEKVSSYSGNTLIIDCGTYSN